MEFYELKTNYATYYVKIEKDLYEGMMDRVSIGGNKKCMIISVHFDGDNPMLNGIGFDNHCNITSNHMNKHGTLHLLKSGISFILEYYKAKMKHIEYMDFKDTSHFDCSQDYVQNMITFYIANYRMTWYEAKLYAIHEKKEDQEKYKSSIVELKNVLNTKPLFESIVNIKKSNRLEFLRKQYDNSKNIKQFLTNIKTQDCYIYKGWLDSFINQYVPNMYGIIMKFPMRKHMIDIEIIRKETQPKEMFVYVGGIRGEVEMGGPQYI